MNLDLRALHEDGRMLRKMADPASVAKASKHAGRELVIGRAGEHFGLSFTKATDRRQAYLGDEPLSAMKMIEECVLNEPALKSAYQLLSGVAHGLWHGHARLLQRSEGEIPGTVGQAGGRCANPGTRSRGRASMRVRARWTDGLVHRLEPGCPHGLYELSQRQLGACRWYGLAGL